MSINVVSLFSGIGGMDLGAIRAGLNIIASYEVEQKYCDGYTKVTGLPVVNADLRGLSWDTIPDCDGVIGGVPCQDFSFAGDRMGKNGVKNLFPYALDFLRYKQPQWFLWENVVALVTQHSGYFQEILDTARNLGYKIRWSILNAADYGVPQTRNRVFISGMRDEKTWRFPFPTHSKHGDIFTAQWVSMYDAVSDWFQREHEHRNVVERIRPQVEHLLSMRDNIRYVIDYRHGIRPVTIRTHDQPCFTIISSVSGHMPQVIHNGHTYRVDVEFLARIQTFDRWDVPLGGIGNAVPPLLAQRIFEEMIHELA